MRGNPSAIINTIMKNKKQQQSDFRVHFTLLDVHWKGDPQALKDQIVYRVGADCKVHLLQIKEVQDHSYDVTVGLYNDVQAYHYLSMSKQRGITVGMGPKPMINAATQCGVYKPRISNAFGSYMGKLDESNEHRNKEQANKNMNKYVPSIPAAKQSPIILQQEHKIANPLSVTGTIPTFNNLLPTALKRTNSDSYVYQQPHVNITRSVSSTYPNNPEINVSNINTVNTGQQKPMIDAVYHRYSQPHIQQQTTSCLWAFGIPSEFTPIDIYHSLKSKYINIKLQYPPIPQSAMLDEQQQLNSAIMSTLKISRISNMQYMQIPLSSTVQHSYIYYKLCPKVSNYPYVIIPAPQHKITNSLLIRNQVMQELSKFTVEINVNVDYDNEKKMVMLVDQLGGVNIMIRYDTNKDDNSINCKYVVVFNCVQPVDKFLTGSGSSWLKKQLERDNEYLRSRDRDRDRDRVYACKPYPLVEIGRILKHFSFESVVMEMSAKKYGPYK